MDIEKLVEQLSLKVAEIDGYEQVANKPASFVLAQIVKHRENITVLESHEAKHVIEILTRSATYKNWLSTS